MFPMVYPVTGYRVWCDLEPDPILRLTAELKIKSWLSDVADVFGGVGTDFVIV